MNCKQGDIALVVRSEAGNEGKTCTCLELIIVGPDDIFVGIDDDGNHFRLKEGAWWHVDRSMNMVSGPDTNGQYAPTGSAPFMKDAYLRPIGDSKLAETISESEEAPS